VGSRNDGGREEGLRGECGFLLRFLFFWFVRRFDEGLLAAISLFRFFAFSSRLSPSIASMISCVLLPTVLCEGGNFLSASTLTRLRHEFPSTSFRGRNPQLGEVEKL